MKSKIGYLVQTVRAYPRDGAGVDCRAKYHSKALAAVQDALSRGEPCSVDAISSGGGLHGTISISGRGTWDPKPCYNAPGATPALRGACESAGLVSVR